LIIKAVSRLEAWKREEKKIAKGRAENFGADEVRK
jgi:hypothetical protein